MKHEFSVERHHHGDNREDENRSSSDKPNHRQAGLILRDITKSVFNSAGAFLFFLSSSAITRRNCDQRDDERRKRTRISEKCRSHPQRTNKDARKRKAHHPRTVKNRSINRNRALNFIAFHQFRHEAVKGGHFERIRKAMDRRENKDLPNRDVFAPNQEPE